MHVFIDSNQFISDFLLRSAPFRYLLHFLSNSGATLLLSRLVIEEVENKHAVEAHRAMVDVDKSLQRLNQLGLFQDATVDRQPLVPTFNLEKRIREHVEGLEIVEYAGVPHADVVQRALKRRKPFDADGDVGYRDCLLWLSFVQHLAAKDCSNSEEVIFISNNWRDFYGTSPSKQNKSSNDGKAKQSGQPGQLDTAGRAACVVPSAQESKTEVQFHPDLAHDLTKLKRAVLPFDSVAAFVDTKVDKQQHAINYEKKYEFFEVFLEESGLNVLRQLDESNGQLILRHLFSPSTASALTILASDAETEVRDGTGSLTLIETGQLCRWRTRGAQDLVVGMNLHPIPHTGRRLKTELSHSETTFLNGRDEHQQSFSVRPRQRPPIKTGHSPMDGNKPWEKARFRSGRSGTPDSLRSLDSGLSSRHFFAVFGRTFGVAGEHPSRLQSDLMC